MSLALFGSHMIGLGSVLTGLFLILAMAVSNLRKRYIGLTIYVIASACSLYFGFINIFGLFAIAIFGALCYQFSFKKTGWLNALYGVLIFFLSILLMLHLIPGFDNPMVIENVAVSENAPLYSQYLNLDKALVGFFLLIYVISTPPKLSYEGFLSVTTGHSLAYGIAILLAITCGLVEYDIKFPDYILVWILVNLFITTYAEEAFFRGFIQTSVHKLFEGKRTGDMLTCLVSGLLFGIAHLPGGIVYVAVASTLGISYAYGYLRTGNILVPIVGHFLFNLIHFTVFTYPFIAQG